MLAEAFTELLLAVTGQSFASNLEATQKKIVRLLLHTLAHVYHAHYQDMVRFGLNAHLNTLTYHFMLFAKVFHLSEERDFQMLGDLFKLLDQLTHTDDSRHLVLYNGIFVPVNADSNSLSAFLTLAVNSKACSGGNSSAASAANAWPENQSARQNTTFSMLLAACHRQPIRQRTFILQYRVGPHVINIIVSRGNAHVGIGCRIIAIAVFVRNRRERPGRSKQIRVFSFRPIEEAFDVSFRHGILEFIDDGTSTRQDQVRIFQ